MVAQSRLVNHVRLPKSIPITHTPTTRSTTTFVTPQAIPPLPDDHLDTSITKDLTGHHHATQNAKVVFVMGATGTGKSRLSITLARRFGGEVVNSDKIQVHAGLPVTTNKVTDEECAGVPHHLLAVIDSHADLSSSDFRSMVMGAVDTILGRRMVPVVAGGSNNYIEALVDGDDGRFRSMYDCSFLWVDVAFQVLASFLSERVDKMIGAGMVDEAREMFDLNNTDYSRGIRRSIGVPELDAYFRAEAAGEDEERKQALLVTAIAEIKANTFELARRQVEKIERLQGLPGWRIHRIDATEYFLRTREDALVAEEVWEEKVAGLSIKFVESFIKEEEVSHGDKAAGEKVAVPSIKLEESFMAEGEVGHGDEMEEEALEEKVAGQSINSVESFMKEEGVVVGHGDEAAKEALEEKVALPSIKLVESSMEEEEVGHGDEMSDHCDKKLVAASAVTNTAVPMAMAMTA